MFASALRVSEHVAVIIAKVSFRNLLVGLMERLCMHVLFNRIRRVCRAGLGELVSMDSYVAL